MWIEKAKGLEPPTFATQKLDNGRFELKLRIDVKESYSLEESEMGVWKQGDVRHDCVSDFALAAIESELPPLEFVIPTGELPKCS